MLQTCNAAASTPLLAPDRYNDEHCTAAERPARAATNVDIRDITQSIIEDIFTMTMLADTAESKLDFAELQKALAEAGELSGVNVSIQREDVFNFMYRL